MRDQEVDVRLLPKPDKHPRIFAAFDELAVGGSFVLVNNHDPRHLREEFDTEFPSGFGWDYVERGPAAWRIRISKLASTPLPRLLADAQRVTGEAGGARFPAAAGAVWKLQMSRRDLDSNIIRLQPDAAIGRHAGPERDVLLLVLAGAGRLGTELGTVDMHPGALIWLPRRSQREITAGNDGLAYLTVHQRRQALVLNAAAAASAVNAVRAEQAMPGRAE